MISYSDMINTMQEVDEWGKRVPFTITYCTYSRQTGKGGELIELKDFTLPPGKGYNQTLNLYCPTSKQFRKVNSRLILIFNNQPVVD